MLEEHAAAKIEAKCGGPSTTLRSGRDDDILERVKEREQGALKVLLAGSVPCWGFCCGGAAGALTFWLTGVLLSARIC